MGGLGIDALVWYVAFVLSTTAHEAAHAWAAWIGGDSTAYRGGQVTLNPMPHIRREPFGMVVMPLIGLFSGGFCLGWASTPYDPRWEQRYPRRAAWMAAAGPGANAAIAFGALALLWTGLASGAFAAPDSVGFSRYVIADTPFLDGAGRFLSVLLTLNTILMLFNLFPIPPLDGASAVTLLLPERTGARFKQSLLKPGIALPLFLGLFLGFQYLVPGVFRTLIALVHPGLSYG